MDRDPSGAAAALDLLAGLLALPAMGGLLFLLVTLPQYGIVVVKGLPVSMLALALVAMVFGWLGLRYERR